MPQTDHLTEAVTEISTDAGDAAFLHVARTEYVKPNLVWDAKEFAGRFYRRDRGYAGPLHIVGEEVDDGFHIMVMKERTPGGQG